MTDSTSIQKPLGYIFMLRCYVTLQIASHIGLKYSAVVKSKISVFLIFIFSSHLAVGSSFKVQKIPLSFRSGNRAGVLADASIKGQKLWLLVDTGASGHSLNYEIVQKLKLPQGSTGAGSTPYGDIQTIDIGTVPASIGGISLELQDTISVKNEKSGLEEDA